MKLTVQEKEYNLRLLCGKFRELREAMGGGNLMEKLTEAMGNSDAEALGKALRVVCLSPRLANNEAAFAVIDGYLEEGHTVMDFGNLLLEVLDESGFLPKRGMAATIQEQTAKAMEKLDETLGELETAPVPFLGYKA